MRAALQASAATATVTRKVLVSASVNPVTSSAASSASSVSTVLQFRRHSSLIFELEDCELEPVPSLSAAQRADTIVQTACGGGRLGASQQQLWEDALAARDRLSNGHAKTCVDVRAFSEALAAKGYIVWVRNGTYRCPRGLGIHNVRNTFVLAELPSSSSQPVYCIVDPNWKDHFEISGAGAEDYIRLVAALPGVFVGGAEQLSALVHLLCAEMEKVFEGRGVALPPWRCPGVLAGRWLVNHAEDEPVQAAPCNTAESAALTPQPTLMPAS